MEGETRTNINYLDQLYKFHRQQGHPVLKIPQLDKRPIDLFRLKKEVAARGGYQKVCIMQFQTDQQTVHPTTHTHDLVNNLVWFSGGDMYSFLRNRNINL